MHQIATSASRLRFELRLFEAVMQGEQAPRSIIKALERVAAEADSFDAVVIIRGGGATSDLATLDDYDLAANVAQFPLPVIAGIGHERDRTVLDDVAWLSVKTPTAAAEWLIAQGMAELDMLRRLAAETVRLSSEQLSGRLRRLDYICAMLPQLAAGHIQQRRSRLDAVAEQLPQLVEAVMNRRTHRLDTLSELVEALSPAATMARGYSVLRVDGRAVSDPADIAPGAMVEATMAHGTILLTPIIEKTEDYI